MFICQIYSLSENTSETTESLSTKTITTLIFTFNEDTECSWKSKKKDTIKQAAEQSRQLQAVNTNKVNVGQLCKELRNNRKHKIYAEYLQ